MTKQTAESRASTVTLVTDVQYICSMDRTSNSRPIHFIPIRHYLVAGEKHESTWLDQSQGTRSCSVSRTFKRDGRNPTLSINYKINANPNYAHQTCHCTLVSRVPAISKKQPGRNSYKNPAVSVLNKQYDWYYTRSLL
jgi:hypothetical protein